MGDFVSAVYSPYGGDEYLTNRYDTFYGDYDDSGKFSRQYRNVSWFFPALNWFCSISWELLDYF